MKAHIIQHGTAPAKVGTRSIKGATLTDQVQQPRTLHWNGRRHRSRREGLPTRVHRAHKSAAIAGVIEAQKTGETARKVDWAGLIEMTPSSTSTNSGTNADAATTMRWKNDALDELGTMATRYAKMRQQAIDATKACEATNRCKEAHAQDRNDMVQESRQRARETQEHTEKRDGTEKGEDEHRRARTRRGVRRTARKVRRISGTHSGKTKQDQRGKRERVGGKNGHSVAARGRDHGFGNDNEEAD
ncbi:hypothetical protein ERJ75_000627300 [Trypanosoma vivax]|nr:hypothetical protein ERJ75_000627300 [Trypanosoma vivax]